MIFTKLGQTSLEVSKLALGGLFISRVGGEFEQAKKATLKALELGVNYIDTAPGYLNSEEVLGKILRDADKPVILSTKLGGRPDPFLPQDKDCLMKSVEESLKLLGRDSIDILMIHEADRPGQFAWWTDYESYNGPVLELLDTLKKDGVIRYTGVGGTTAYEMAHVIATGRFDVVLTAFNYSLLWREAEISIIPAAKKAGMGIIVGSPLQQGALAGKYAEVKKGARWLSLPRQKQFQTLYKLADEIRMPVPELAIRFVISNPDVDCVLMGARSEREVEQNVEAVERGTLDKSVLSKLDDIYHMVPFRPFDEPFGLPFGYEYTGPGRA